MLFQILVAKVSKKIEISKFLCNFHTGMIPL